MSYIMNYSHSECFYLLYCIICKEDTRLHLIQYIQWGRYELSSASVLAPVYSKNYFTVNYVL